MNEQTIAKKLDSYLQFRANREDVDYDLNPEFFHVLLKDGISNFFGITVNNGKLETDEQNPQAFLEWNNYNFQI